MEEPTHQGARYPTRPPAGAAGCGGRPRCTDRVPQSGRLVAAVQGDRAVQPPVAVTDPSLVPRGPSLMPCGA